MKNNGDYLFDNVKPRGAPPELRERVLSAVAKELSTDIIHSWENRIGWLVAAAAVFGVVLNLWAVRTNERRLADIAGPHPVPQQVSEMVEIVESVTGRGTGEWIQQSLVKAWRSRSVPPPPRLPNWEQLINDLEIN